MLINTWIVREGLEKEDEWRMRSWIPPSACVLLWQSGKLSQTPQDDEKIIYTTVIMNFIHFFSFSLMYPLKQPRTRLGMLASATAVTFRNTTGKVRSKKCTAVYYRYIPYPCNGIKVNRWTFIIFLRLRGEAFDEKFLFSFFFFFLSQVQRFSNK